MSFETVYLIREIELLADGGGPMTLHVYTDLPGYDVTAKASFPFDTEATTEERRPVRLRMPGTVKGQLKKLRIDGASSLRLFGVRVYAKPLGGPGAWNWYSVPVVKTPEGYSAAALPIVPTPEGFSAAALPIVPTPEGWDVQPLPLVASAREWQWVRLPVDEVE